MRTHTGEKPLNRKVAGITPYPTKFQENQEGPFDFTPMYFSPDVTSFGGGQIPHHCVWWRIFPVVWSTFGTWHYPNPPNQLMSGTATCRLSQRVTSCWGCGPGLSPAHVKSQGDPDREAGGSPPHHSGRSGPASRSGPRQSAPGLRKSAISRAVVVGRPWQSWKTRDVVARGNYVNETEW